MSTKTKTSHYDSSGLEALTPRAPWSQKNKHLLSHLLLSKLKKGLVCKIQYLEFQTTTTSGSRGLMDKALASGAGDCGFESHRDRFLSQLFSF